MITKDKFVELLTSFVILKNTDNELRSILKKIDSECRTGMSFFTAETQMIKMLELLAEDTEGWISYWVYECDCGRKDISDGVRTQDDKTPIPFRTPGDVYECIKKY